MIETGGFAQPNGKGVETSPLKIRFNVNDIKSALQHLKQKGITAEIEGYDWGSTINIFGPDGNRIGIRDEKGFKSEISNHD